ncbi:MAG: hypothetical protein HYT87_16770 [Nitrospirae bacterium]|nr:hypothetical protein [Nitrospirota bacterium]
MRDVKPRACVMAILFLITLYSSLFTGVSNALAQAAIRIAVLNFRGQGVDQAVADLATTSFVNGLGQLGPVNYVTPAQFTQAAGPDYVNRIYGCKNDTTCIFQMVESLPADRLFLGTVAGGAGSWSVTVKMVNLRSGGSSVTVVTSPTQTDRLPAVVQGVGKQLVLKEQRSQLGPGGFNEVFETEYSKGLSDYYSGQYASAHSHLDAAISADPNVRQVYYYAGVSAYLSGNMEHAKEHLNRAKGMNPQTDAEIDYYLGLVAYKQEGFAEATARFQSVRDNATDPRMKEMAEEHLVVLQQARKRKALEEKNWKVTTGLGVQEDSNVILSPLNLEEGFRGTRTQLALDGAVWTLPTPESRLTADLSASQTLHFEGENSDIRKYDMTFAMLDGSALRYFDNENYRFDAHAGAGVLLFRKAPSYIEVNGSAGVSRVLGDRAALGIVIPGRYDHYVRTDSSIAQALTIVNTGAFSFLSVDIIQGLLQSRIELGYDRNEPVKDSTNQFAYNGFRSDLSLGVLLPADIQWSVFTGYHHKAWDRTPAPAPAQSGTDQQTGSVATVEEGSEKTFRIGTGLYKSFASRLYLDSGFNYTVNRDTGTQRDYNRWILSLMLGLTF